MAPLMALSACATAAPEKTIRVVEKNTAVAVSCVPKDLKDPPVYPYTRDQIKAATGPPERYLMLGAVYTLMDQRLGELEPVVTHCR